MLCKKNDQQIRKDYFYLMCIYEATHKKEYCASPPIEVAIEASNFCNLKCTHCAHEIMKRKKGHMSLELFKKIIDDIAYYQPYIDLHLHGEPLLNKQLPAMIAYTKEKGLENRLITNTTLLTREKSKELLASGLDYICLSVSGVTRKTYESIHRNAKFEKTLNNILDFLEMEYEMNKFIRTRTVFVEEEKTINEKNRYLEMFGKLPIGNVSISPMFNFFGKNKEINVDKFHNLPREEWPVCTFPWKWLGVGSNGDIRACFFDYEHRYIIGNAKDVNVMEAWNSPAMQKFRKALLNREFSEIEKNGPLCSQCNQIWQMDGHGCTSQWPVDMSKEIENFFEKGPKAFVTNIDLLKNKFIYLRKHRNEWLEQMLSM